MRRLARGLADFAMLDISARKDVARAQWKGLITDAAVSPTETGIAGVMIGRAAVAPLPEALQARLDPLTDVATPSANFRRHRITVTDQGLRPPPPRP